MTAATVPQGGAWRLDALIAHVVRQVVRSGKTPAEVIDAMAPIQIDQLDQWTVMRAGLIAFANTSQSIGMRPYRKRSGGIQSVRGPRGEVRMRGALVSWALGVLTRLVFEKSDGTMDTVLDWAHGDAVAAYERRVTSPRDTAKREAPFWQELIKETAIGRSLRQRPASVQGRLAKLAVSAGLTEA